MTSPEHRPRAEEDHRQHLPPGVDEDPTVVVPDLVQAHGPELGERAVTVGPNEIRCVVVPGVDAVVERERARDGAERHRDEERERGERGQSAQPQLSRGHEQRSEERVLDQDVDRREEGHVHEADREETAEPPDGERPRRSRIAWRDLRGALELQRQTDAEEQREEGEEFADEREVDERVCDLAREIGPGLAFEERVGTAEGLDVDHQDAERGEASDDVEREYSIVDGAESRGSGLRFPG